MGRFILYSLAFAVVFPAVAAAHLGEPGGAPGRPAVAPGAAPELRTVKRQPLTVHGLRFAAREQVVVTLHGPDGGMRMQTAATADVSGSFTVSFGEPRSRCDTLVRAVGSRGNRAVLKLLPPPFCLPA